MNNVSSAKEQKKRSPRKFGTQFERQKSKKKDLWKFGSYNYVNGSRSPRNVYGPKIVHTPPANSCIYAPGHDYANLVQHKHSHMGETFNILGSALIFYAHCPSVNTTIDTINQLYTMDVCTPPSPTPTDLGHWSFTQKETMNWTLHSWNINIQNLNLPHTHAQPPIPMAATL